MKALRLISLFILYVALASPVEAVSKIRGHSALQSLTNTESTPRCPGGIPLMSCNIKTGCQTKCSK